MADNFLQSRRGDVLYSWRFGEVTIKGVEPDAQRPVIGHDTESGELRWTATGRIQEMDENQDLFWSRPVIDPPLPPVRTVKLQVPLVGFWAVYAKNLYGPFNTKIGCSTWIANQTIPTPASPEYRALEWLVVVPEGTTVLPDDRK